MSQNFGRELPTRHIQLTHRGVTRYLVVIQAPEGPIAKLMLQNHELVAELDANTEEVASTLRGLAPSIGTTGPEWDKALAGHSRSEREQAEVYVLPT